MNAGIGNSGFENSDAIVINFDNNIMVIFVVLILALVLFYIYIEIFYPHLQQLYTIAGTRCLDF